MEASFVDRLVHGPGHDPVEAPNRGLGRRPRGDGSTSGLSSSPPRQLFPIGPVHRGGGGDRASAAAAAGALAPGPSVDDLTDAAVRRPLFPPGNGGGQQAASSISPPSRPKIKHPVVARAGLPWPLPQKSTPSTALQTSPRLSAAAQPPGPAPIRAASTSSDDSDSDHRYADDFYAARNKQNDAEASGPGPTGDQRAVVSPSPSPFGRRLQGSPTPQELDDRVIQPQFNTYEEMLNQVVEAAGATSDGGGVGANVAASAAGGGGGGGGSAGAAIEGGLSGVLSPGDVFSDDSAGALARVSCKHCSRKFRADRLERHEAVCKRPTYVRKPFDSSHARVTGTQAELYNTPIGARSASPDVVDRRRRGGGGGSGGRPTASASSPGVAAPGGGGGGGDAGGGGSTASRRRYGTAGAESYVTCPTCGRNFSKPAALRHLPICQKV